MGILTVSARKPALTITFERFERMPDKPGKQELLEGELIELPPPKLKHSRNSHRIYKRLDAALAEAHARGEAGEPGEVYIEMGYRLSEKSYVQPDISVTFAGQVEGEYLEGAPAVAVEIVSPSNKATEMEKKIDLYFQHGAREVWRVYGDLRHIVIHLNGTSRTLTENEILSTPLLPGFQAAVREILE